MKKANSRIRTFIKMILIFSVILLFLFLNIGEGMVYAMSSKLFLTLVASKPTPKPIPKSTSEPIPKSTSEPIPKSTSEPIPKSTSEPIPKSTSEPIPKSTSEPIPKSTSEPIPKSTSEPIPKSTSEPTPVLGRVAVQPQQAISTRQILPIDPPHVPSAPATTMISASATPTRTLVAGTPIPTAVTPISGSTAVLSALPVASPEQDDDTLRLVFVLGVLAPLLLITGGTLWLSMKWLVNRQRLMSTAKESLNESMKADVRKVCIERRSR